MAKNRMKRSRILSVESLESRKLLTGIDIAWVPSDGKYILQIDGNAASDTVLVSQDTKGTPGLGDDTIRVDVFHGSVQDTKTFNLFGGFGTEKTQRIHEIEFVGQGGDDNVTNDTVLDIIALESLQPGGSMLSMYNSGSEFGVGGSNKSDIAEVHKSIYGNILIGKIEHGSQSLSLTVRTPSNSTSGSAPKISFHGGNGNDRFTNNTDYAANASGGLGNDTLIGGSANDEMYGDFAPGEHVPNIFASMNDVLNGRGGDDSLWGGVGTDTINGGDGNDKLDGGFGDDTVYGGNGNDTIEGQQGNDTLYGDGGEDHIWGDSNSDDLISGNDRIQGGNDNDWVWGGRGDDTIDGDAGNDVLNGGAGDDLISGGADHDKIYGMQGDDYIFGNDGNDELWGDDWCAANQSGKETGVDFLDGGNGNDELHGGNQDDYLLGGAGDDILYGDLGNDLLSGGVGGDQLIGGGGDDALYGGTGDDFLWGDRKEASLSIGNDKLFGGDGLDVLDGGTGSDVLEQNGPNYPVIQPYQWKLLKRR